MTPIWLIRMAHWVRHPPSLSRVILVLVVVVICLGLYGIEYLGLVPKSWATKP
jgi:hypothetical protein